MKRIFAILLLLPALAFGAENDIVMMQRNSLDTGLTPSRLVAVPTNGDNAILGYNGGSTQLPVFYGIGQGLTLVNGVLSASGGSSSPTWASITGTPTTLAGYGITDAATSASLANYATTAALTAGLSTKFNAPTGTTAQYIRGDGSLATFPTSPAMSINDTPGRSLVTTTAATGYQISATRAAQVCYEGNFSTTSTIGGPSSATVFLETADTNSTTPSDWTTKAQQTYSNTITLAVVLNQVQSNNWSFCRTIPAGKFVRLRSGGITGTASASLNTTQQETLY